MLTRETGGSYHVILDESHFKELLMLHVKPPPASSSSECSLIRMGEFLYMLLGLLKTLQSHHNSAYIVSYMGVRVPNNTDGALYCSCMKARKVPLKVCALGNPRRNH